MFGYIEMERVVSEAGGRYAGARARTARIVATCLWALAGVGLLLGGCATGSSGAEGPADPIPAVPVSLAGQAAQSAAEVFASLAHSLSPVTVYGLECWPGGSEMAEEWWPVLEMQSAIDYEGPPVANPRVVDPGSSDGEAQVVLDCRAGTLVVLENFRGDLGDVRGAEVGAIESHTAMLYEVNGGSLVQWSDAGRWYGVFGRSVTKDELVAIALQMKVVSVESGK